MASRQYKGRGKSSALGSPLWAHLPKAVTLYEVGPRDGLQNEATQIPTDVKVALINALSDAGFKAIEATSFVSPKWVPQLADAADVMARMRWQPGVAYPVLTPNIKGLENAIAAGAKHVAIFGAASEAFSQRNINCSVAESLKRFEAVVEMATTSGVAVRGYVSCVVGCPYQGFVDPVAAADVAKALWQMGCYEVSMGDTIGVGTPASTARMFEATMKHVPVERLAAHMHDTYGQALANIMVALQMGVPIIDASVAGLGGCPYAKGASGNVATEDVVYMLDGFGIQHGIDMAKLLSASQLITGALGRRTSSRAAAALTAAQGAALLGVSPHLPGDLARAAWTLDDFVLQERIGAGATSVVHKAVCKRSGRTLALKIYQISMLSEMTAHHVMREVRLHLSLQHTHIVALYAAFQEGGSIVLVEEFAAGGSLYAATMQKGRHMSEAGAVQVVIAPLLGTLCFLHSRGIVHRDIKLENCLLSASGQLLLADFGLAINTREERAVTRAGTLEYVAPEVLGCPSKAFPYDNKSNAFVPGYGTSADLWSVGVLAHELVTGTSPFSGAAPEGADATVVAASRARGAPPPRGASAGCARFVASALTVDPINRPCALALLASEWVGAHARAQGW
ncbi:hypothetical protein FOA52_001164 [Chlamydomonas sp. UWO 241]|nr:hypothetical protein FOA52_001164 [Chlamydomonas sp. UWO 241]